MKDPANKEKNNPFRVPEGYFDDVTRKIIADTIAPAPVSMRRRFAGTARIICLAAASLAAIALVTVTVLKTVSPAAGKKDADLELNSADQELLYGDIDLYMLEESLASASMNSEETGLSSSELIEYLLLDNIELTDIYDNL
ncbi:MAG: hypothetical protein MUD02_01505 [Bacteroidales bacterium]|jgi:hypothetical protein|nr:hypothetical protein [Bacteroidales bacterium]MCU0407599.1 hypothetical protein [Bacteroidales bacterium]